MMLCIHGHPVTDLGDGRYQHTTTEGFTACGVLYVKEAKQA